MSIEINKINLIEKSQVILKEMNPSISPEDKKVAKTKLNVVDSTISIYLNGKGVNLDTALMLIGFFQKRITQREKAISKLAS